MRAKARRKFAVAMIVGLAAFGAGPTPEAQNAEDMPMSRAGQGLEVTFGASNFAPAASPEEVRGFFHDKS